MPYERTVEIAVADGVLVRFHQSGRPIERYSVVLLALDDDIWKTVRVYDNHLGTNHMHRYTLSEPVASAIARRSCPANGLPSSTRLPLTASPSWSRSLGRATVPPS